MTRELMNISVYDMDLDRFGGSWENVRKFYKSLGLDGIELLIGFEPPKSIPLDMVTGIHLPAWMGWIGTWKNPEGLPLEINEYEERYFYGARNEKTLLDRFCNILKNASLLKPEYAVVHVTHIDLKEFYTRNHRYTNREVLDAAADFFNATAASFSGGEPPVKLSFENLWWPGLNLYENEETLRFCNKLEFSNWAFTLDSGHMMNGLDCNSEEEGIDLVIKTLGKLDDEIIDKIESMHFHFSASGRYQKENFWCSPPVGFDSMCYNDKITEVMKHVGEIDQHKPFTCSKCREIVDLVSPDFVTYEFVTRTRSELETKIRQQYAALHDKNKNL